MYNSFKLFSNFTRKNQAAVFMAASFGIYSSMQKSQYQTSFNLPVFKQPVAYCADKSTLNESKNLHVISHIKIIPYLLS